MVDRAIARRQAEDRGMFVARWPSLHPLDIFTPSIDFSYEAARTRVRRRLDDRDAWFLSAEGIAIFKLLFFRGKDRVDLERLVQVRPQLDRAYIRRRLVEDLGRRAGHLLGCGDRALPCLIDRRHISFTERLLPFPSPRGCYPFTGPVLRGCR